MTSPLQSFAAIIGLWDTARDLAKDIGRDEDAGAKLVQAWKMRDSIPAEWFAAIERAAKDRGLPGVSVDLMARLAEENRLGKETARQDAAA